MEATMISLTEKARKKLQENEKNLPEQKQTVWNITFLGFG
jgi:hypothetical protein